MFRVTRRSAADRRCPFSVHFRTPPSNRRQFRAKQLRYLGTMWGGGRQWVCEQRWEDQLVFFLIGIRNKG